MLFYAAWVRTDPLAVFTSRMKKLEALACPSDEDIPFFNEHIQLASQQGMNYREGLEFVIRMREGGAH